MRLAQIGTARRGGFCLEEISLELSESHRTAQRMTDALEATFANVTIEEWEDRQRYWRIADPQSERLKPRPEATVEALEIAIRTAREESRSRHASALDTLRDALIAPPPSRDVHRTEAYVEAVLGLWAISSVPGRADCWRRRSSTRLLPLAPQELRDMTVDYRRSDLEPPP